MRLPLAGSAPVPAAPSPRTLRRRRHFEAFDALIEALGLPRAAPPAAAVAAAAVPAQGARLREGVPVAAFASSVGVEEEALRLPLLRCGRVVGVDEPLEFVRAKRIARRLCPILLRRLRSTGLLQLVLFLLGTATGLGHPLRL